MKFCKNKKYRVRDGVLLRDVIEVLLIAFDVDVAVPSLDDELDVQVHEPPDHWLDLTRQHRETFLVGNEQTERGRNKENWWNLFDVYNYKLLRQY